MQNGGIGVLVAVYRRSAVGENRKSCLLNREAAGSSHAKAVSEDLARCKLQKSGRGCLSSDNGIREFTDLLDLDLDEVSWTQEERWITEDSHTTGGPGCDDVTR